MPDHLLNDEIQEFLGEIRIQVGLFRKVFQPRNLRGFTRGVRGRKIMFRLQLAHGLGVFEPLSERVDKDRIQPVDAGAMALEKLGRTGHDIGLIISQWRILSG